MHSCFQYIKEHEIPVSIERVGNPEFNLYKQRKGKFEDVWKRLPITLKEQFTNYVDSSIFEALDLIPESEHPKLLNRYGNAVFCKFQFTDPDADYLSRRGIYIIKLKGQPVYVGMTTKSFKERCNNQYFKIAPYNCYRGGRSTNIKINSLIHIHFSDIEFFFYPMDKEDKDIEIDEGRLIDELQTLQRDGKGGWNAKSGRRENGRRDNQLRENMNNYNEKQAIIGDTAVRGQKRSDRSIQSNGANKTITIRALGKDYFLVQNNRARTKYTLTGEGGISYRGQCRYIFGNILGHLIPGQSDSYVHFTTNQRGNLIFNHVGENRVLDLGQADIIQ